MKAERRSARHAFLAVCVETGAAVLGVTVNGWFVP